MKGFGYRLVAAISGLAMLTLGEPAAGAAPAVPSMTVVASSGQTTPDGGVFNAFGEPDINNQGVMGFLGLTSKGTNLYLATPSQMAPIALEGSPAPGGVGSFATPPGNLNSSGPFPFIPRLDNAGDAYYLGYFYAGGTNLYADAAGDFMNNGMLAVDGSPTPDGSAFDFGINVPPQVSRNGVAALLTSLSTNPPSGIYRFSAGSWQKVVRSGDPTPEGDGVFSPSNPEDVMGFSPPGVNDSGQVAFTAVKRLSNPPQGAFASPYRDGLYLAGGGGLQKLVAEGESLPDGRTAGGMYNVQHGPALNAAGEVAVLMGTSSATGTPDGSGIYLFNGQGILPVLHTGDPAPGGSGQVICALGHPGLGDDGTLAFTATLGQAGSACLSGTAAAFVVGQPGNLTLAAQIPISSEVSMQGGPSIGPDMPYVNAHGQVAFIVTANGGNETLDVWDGQSVVRIAASGDQIGRQTVTKLDFAGEDAPGATGLNDNGQLVFRAFGAQSSQIVLASLNGNADTAQLPGWVSQMVPTGSTPPSGSNSNSSGFPFPVVVGSQQIEFQGTVSDGTVGTVNGNITTQFNLETGQGGILLNNADLQLGTDASGNPAFSGTLEPVTAGNTVAAPVPSSVTVAPGETLLVLDSAGNYALIQIISANASAVAFKYVLQSGVSAVSSGSQPSPTPPPSPTPSPSPTPPPSPTPSPSPVPTPTSGYPLTVPGLTSLNSSGMLALPNGSEPDQTTVGIALTEYPSGVNSKTVVLASGSPDNLVDALTAGPLATYLNAPLLLTASSTQLGGDLAYFLESNQIQKIYLIGALGGVDQSQMAQELAQVVPGAQLIPIAGNDRIQTSVAIAHAMPASSILFVASALNAHLVDAVAASPAASQIKAPILLDTPTIAPPSDLIAGVTKTYVIGAAGAYQAVNQLLPNVTVLVGSGRNQTALQIAEQFFANATKAVVASGNDADLQWALAAGPLAAVNHAPVLLAESGNLTSAQQFLGNTTVQQVLIGGALASDSTAVAQLTGSGNPPSPTPSPAPAPSPSPSPTPAPSPGPNGTICAQKTQAVLSSPDGTTDLLNLSFNTLTDANSNMKLLQVTVNSPTDVSDIQVYQSGQYGSFPWTHRLSLLSQNGNTWTFLLNLTDLSVPIHVDVSSPTLKAAGYDPAKVLWSPNGSVPGC